MAVFVSLLVAAAFTSGRSTADLRAEATTHHELVGTWKLVKATYGGSEYKIPEGTTEFKHVTPTHFVLTVIDKDGRVFAAIGGPYVLGRGKYEETPEYGLSEIFTNIKGKPQSFECSVEGNTWYHNGTLSNGLTIEEVWERVQKQ
jgi:hypothetical protein